MSREIDLKQIKAYYYANADTNSIGWPQLTLTERQRWIARWIQADEPDPDVKVDGGPDMVAHPPHYETNGPPCAGCGRPIQCIEVREGMTANLSDAVKYIWRNGQKDGADRVDDLRKSRWYVDREIKRLEARKGSAA